MNTMINMLKVENDALRILQQTTENAFLKALKEKDAAEAMMLAHKTALNKRNSELAVCALECKNRKRNMKSAAVSVGAARIMLDTYIRDGGDPEMVRILDTLTEALRFL